MSNPIEIQTGIFSVTDKSGLEELVPGIINVNPDFEIWSTGGTYGKIAEIIENQFGADFVDMHLLPVSDVSGLPETSDGRLKTLVPQVHGAILAIPGDPAWEATLYLIVVNLYAFEETIAKKGVTMDQAIESIDIGGPTMLRGAAKNHKYTTVIIDPDDYPEFLDQIKKNDGCTTLGFRERMAKKVFAETTKYDAAISKYLEKQVGGK